MSDYNVLSLKKPGLPATCPNQVCKWRQNCVISTLREAKRPTYIPRVGINFVDLNQTVWLACKSFLEEGA